MSHIINIVYYIWINPKRNWKVIIEGQLSDMKISKIFEVSKLYIVLSCADNTIMTETKNIINNSLKDIDNNLYEITTTHENNYEYYGIKKLYDLACNDSDKLYIYLHSKGMFNWYNNNPNKRSEDEINLTRNIFNIWKETVNFLNENPIINKVGLIPSPGGWIWFNFFGLEGII